MSPFFKFLSIVFLALMLFSGFERFIGFLKEAQTEYVFAHQPKQTLPEKCAHLYDQPGKHKEWADCMGVGYK